MLINFTLIPSGASILISQTHKGQNCSKHFLHHIESSARTNIYQNPFCLIFNLFYLFLGNDFRLERSNISNLFYFRPLGTNTPINIKNYHFNFLQISLRSSELMVKCILIRFLLLLNQTELRIFHLFQHCIHLIPNFCIVCCLYTEDLFNGFCIPIPVSLHSKYVDAINSFANTQLRICLVTVLK